MDTKSPPPYDEIFLQAAEWFVDFQNRVCATFELLDGGGRFKNTSWEKPAGAAVLGKGEARLMRGNVFEKVGVNFSNVHGVLDEKFAAEIPGAVEAGGRFRASGVSLVAHMRSPLVPAVHLNLRRLETGRGWWGGGADITPYFPFEEDVTEFHSALEKVCNTYSPSAYANFRKWCDEYFFLPHRGEPRGAGGIFFDNLESPNPATEFAFVQAVGEAFLEVFSTIVERRKHLEWTEEQRVEQLIKRGRYVEFNLLYDRGTRFGLMTGANPDTLLMSLPPEVHW